MLYFKTNIFVWTFVCECSRYSWSLSCFSNVHLWYVPITSLEIAVMRTCLIKNKLRRRNKWDFGYW